MLPVTVIITDFNTRYRLGRGKSSLSGKRTRQVAVAPSSKTALMLFVIPGCRLSLSCLVVPPGCRFDRRTGKRENLIGPGSHFESPKEMT